MASSSTSFDVVLDHIFGRLDVATRVRLSVVCRSWRDLSRQALPAMPCFIMTDLLHMNSLYLLDPVFPTADQLLLVRRRVDVHYNIAGCHGPYLIYTLAAPPCYWQPSNAIVYNPFSGETIRLPRTGLHPNASAEPVGYLEMAQLSSTPASCTSPGRTTPCLVAAVASNFRSSVCICRLGVHGTVGGDDQEPYWIASRLLGEDISVKDLIFYSGVLYCICESRTGQCIMAVDLHHLLHDIRHLDDLIMPIWLPAPRLVTVLGNENHPRDGSQQYYLVVVESSTGGELLVATQHQLSDPSTTSTESPPKFVFRLHKVVEEANTNSPFSTDLKTSSSTGRTALLVEVDDLGGTMLFLGRGCSRSWRWSELRNNNNNNAMGETSTFVKEGCIYFVEKSRLGRFCVGKGTDGGETEGRVAEFLPLDRLQPSSSSFCPPWISLPNS